MKSHIFYDYDGTLGDSLPGHMLFICDADRKFNTGLKLPSLDDYETWKRMIGMPMEAFLKNIGFPEKTIPDIMSIYEKTFGANSEYASSLFPGIPEVIKTMFDAGVNQSILSSNFSGNIRPALKKCSLEGYFAYLIDRESMRHYHNGSKADCLRRYNNRLGLATNECIYVGDAEADFEAASNAGVIFVGVSYGWQIHPGDKRFPVANTPSQLQRILLGLTNHEKSKDTKEN